MDNPTSSFDGFNDWLQSVRSTERREAADAPPSVGELTPNDIQSVSVCLADIFEHCSNVQKQLGTLIAGPVSEDRFQSAINETEIQLALAVRNWHELELILQQNGLWQAGTDVFDKLSTFET